MHHAKVPMWTCFYLRRSGLCQVGADAASLFAEGTKPAKANDEPDAAELFEQIGRLKMELEWLKKKLPER